MALVPALPINAGGLNYRLLSLNSTNLGVIKATPGNLVGIQVSNTGTVAFLKLYNLAVNPTLASSVPFMTVSIPPTIGNVVLNLPYIAFDTGLAVAITSGVADTDVATVAANQIVLNVQYN